MEQIGRPSARKKKPPPVVTTIADALALPDPVIALWPNLVACVFRDRGSANLENLSRPCQALYLVDLIDREVQNGGFHQFFWNTSGQFCEQTKWALAELYAKILLSLLERACMVFPAGLVPKDQLARREVLCNLSQDQEDALNRLDIEFNASTSSVRKCVNQPENPWFLALEYMERHAEAKVANE